MASLLVRNWRNLQQIAANRTRLKGFWLEHVHGKSLSVKCSNIDWLGHLLDIIMTFLAHTCTRTRMQTAVNWRQTPAFKPEARQDKERIILISAKSTTSRTTTQRRRRRWRGGQQNLNRSDMQNAFVFGLFPIRLTLTSRQKRNWKNTMGKNSLGLTSADFPLAFTRLSLMLHRWPQLQPLEAALKTF